MHGETLKIIV